VHPGPPAGIPGDQRHEYMRVMDQALDLFGKGDARPDVLIPHGHITKPEKDIRGRRGQLAVFVRIGEKYPEGVGHMNPMGKHSWNRTNQSRTTV